MILETITSLYEEHQVLLGIVASLSVIMFIASILSLPFLVSLIPADYFRYAEPYRIRHPFKHPAIRIILITLKNIFGWLLILAGIIMLVLPGQGLLTLIAGLILINFPGKRLIERKLVSNHKVLRSLNWLRSKRNKPPLTAPE